MQNSTKVTRLELIQILMNGISGGTFVGIDTLTTVKLTGGKKNPMQNKVQKAQVGGSVMAFGNNKSNAYENKVRRHLIAEGKNPDTFQLSPRTWGERIEGTNLVKHTKKGAIEPQYYVEFIFLKAGAVSYLIDGKPIKKELIEGLPERKAEGTQGGVDDKIIIRSYSVDSICRISIDNEVYIIED